MPDSSPPPRRIGLNLGLAATITLSAWLLFQVQPMVAKRILPWFGGGTAVWTTVMLFFQTALLAGYAYAHLLDRRLHPARQVTVHGALLIVAAAIALVRGVLPDVSWQPDDSSHPVLSILVMLAVSVGLQFVLLAATAPLVQTWFARANPGRSPYRLYALSNFGSLAALLSYPLVVEPALGVARQGTIWAALFAGFAVLCALNGYAALRAAGTAASLPRPEDLAPAAAEPHPVGRSPRLERFFWCALPACAVVTLLSITAHLCQDVASIPLLWIAPMVIYLLSFILCFDSDRWYRRYVWLPLMAVGLAAASVTWQVFGYPTFVRQLAIDLGLQFSVSMVCHGELARMRPAPSRLTSYYLSIAVGGALGGLFTGIVAPLIFNDHYELQLGVLAAWFLAIAVLVTDRTSRFYDGGRRLSFATVSGMALLLVGVGAVMASNIAQQREHIVVMSRGFYGVLKVREYLRETVNRFYVLVNGRVSHGSQFQDTEYRRFPTGYYHPDSGIGRVMRLTQANEKKCRVGVVGLGTGTLATYADPGEEFRFYEINPQTFSIANRYFSHVEDASKRGAKVQFIEGDARISLEREEPQNFDVLVIDAFSSDAIPTHLLTMEAFELYLRHLSNPDGILAVHISNTHLNLASVVEAAAERYKLDATIVMREEDEQPTSTGSDWVLLHRRPGFLAQYKLGQPLAEFTAGAPPVPWTDDYTNLLDVLGD